MPTGESGSKYRNYHKGIPVGLVLKVLGKSYGVEAGEALGVRGGLTHVDTLLPHNMSPNNVLLLLPHKRMYI